MKQFCSFRKGQRYFCGMLAALMLCLVPLSHVQATETVTVVPETVEDDITLVDPDKTTDIPPETEGDEPSDEDVKLLLTENSLKVFSDLSAAVRASVRSAPRYQTNPSDFTGNDNKSGAWSKKLNGQKTMFGDKYVTKVENASVENTFNLTLEAGLEDGEKKAVSSPAPSEAYVCLLIDQTYDMMEQYGSGQRMGEQMNNGLSSYFNALQAENEKRMSYARAGVYTDIDPKGDVDAQMENHLIKVLFTMGYNRGQYLRFDYLRDGYANGYKVLTKSDVNYMLSNTQVKLKTPGNLSGTTEQIDNALQPYGMDGQLYADYRIGSAMEAMEDRIEQVPASIRKNLYCVVASMYQSYDARSYDTWNEWMSKNHPGCSTGWAGMALNTNVYISGFPAITGIIPETTGRVIADDFGHATWNVNQANWYLDASRRIKKMDVKIQTMVVNCAYQVDVIRKAVKAKKIEELNTYWYGPFLAIVAGLSSSDYPVNGHLGVTWSWVANNSYLPPSVANTEIKGASLLQDWEGFTKTPYDMIKPGNIFGFPSNFYEIMANPDYSNSEYGYGAYLYFDFLRGADRDFKPGKYNLIRGYAYDYEDGYYPNELGHYTYLPEDASQMISAFASIAGQQSGGKSDAGYASSGTVLTDELSDVFTFPLKRDSVRVYKVPRIPAQMDGNGVPTDQDENGRSNHFRWGERFYTGANDENLTDWIDITEEVGLTVTEDTLSVTGFDYEVNALTDFNKYGRDHYEPGDYGYKIVVEATIVAEETFGGNQVRTDNPEHSGIIPSRPGSESGLPPWEDNKVLNPSGSSMIEKNPLPKVDIFPTNPYQAVAQDIYVYAPQTAPAYNLVMDENRNIFYNDPLYDLLKAEADELKKAYDKALEESREYNEKVYGTANKPGLIVSEGGITPEIQAKLDELKKKVMDCSIAYNEKLAEMSRCVRCVPNGKNNQFVNIDYELTDPDGIVIARMHIPRGKAYTGNNIEWDFSPMGSDIKLTKSGTYHIHVNITPVASTVSPNGYIYTDLDVLNMTQEEKNNIIGSSLFYMYHSEQYSSAGSSASGTFHGTETQEDAHGYLYQLHIKAKDTRLVPNQTIDFFEGMENLAETKNVHLTDVWWECTDGVTPSDADREPGITGDLTVGSGGVNTATTIPERAFNEGKVHKVNNITACGEGDGYVIPVAVQLFRSCGNLDRKVSTVTAVTQVTKYLSDSDNVFGPGRSSVVWEHACDIDKECDPNGAFKNAQSYGTADNGTGHGKIRYLIHVEDNPKPTVTKTTTTPIITRGEEMLWQVTVANNTESENSKRLPADFSLVDIMPYNGDGLVDPLTNYEGSKFNGSLYCTSVSLDLKKFPKGASRLENGTDAVWYTTDTAVRDASEADLIGDTDKINWVKADIKVNGSEANVVNLPKEATAIRYDTTLDWNEQATLRFSTNVDDPNKQANGDRYHNQAGVYNKNGGRLSEVVAVAMTPTSIAGKVWEDANGNGIYDNGEAGIPQVTVTLYQQWTDRNPNPPDRVVDGVKLVRVYDLNYNAVPSQITGEDGSYLFEEANPGVYYIVADEIPFQYTPVPKQAGKGDAALSDMDSECEEAFGQNTDHKLDQTAWIKQVVVADASITGQNFGMQLITGSVEVTKYLDEIYYPSSMTDEEREDYQLVFTFKLRNTENGKEYVQTVRIDHQNFDAGTARCKFEKLPLGIYELTEEPEAQYTLDEFVSSDPGTQAGTRSMRIEVTGANHEFTVDAYNKMTKDPPGGDENGVANFVNVRVPVKLEIQYTGPDPVGNKNIIKYQFTAGDFEDMIVTYDDGTHISLKEGTLRFEDVTLSPATVINLMNTEGNRKLTVNGYYSEKGRVVKDSFRVKVDLKPVHKFRLTFDANGSSFDTGSTKNVVNFAYDDNAGYNIVTGGTYRDVANGGLKSYGAAYGFAGWNTKPDGTGVNYTNRTALDAIGRDPTVSTLTLYAQWTCQVTFHANGGQIARAPGITDSTLTAGEKAAIGKASANVTWNVNQSMATGLAGSKSGYHFVLWNTKPDGTGTDLTKYGPVTGPVTFYAVYYQSDYHYTGAPQTFTAPVDGVYRVQLWGASGGADAGGPGGNGGFVTGSIRLKAGTSLYVYVGAPGRDNGTGVGAGYNGGANSGGCGWSGAGGGATSISLASGPWNNASVLANRIAVAGGGGGAGCHGNGGSAGGLNGFNGSSGAGGTQTNAGTNGGFGYGGCVGSNSDGGGGGGGYYGGGAGFGDQGGGGGSSFINGACGCATVHPNYVFFNASMINGQNAMPAPNGGTEIGHRGGCYVYINLISIG